MVNSSSPVFHQPKISTDFSESQTSNIVKRLREIEDKNKGLEKKILIIESELNKLKSNGAKNDRAVSAKQTSRGFGESKS